MGGTQSNYLNLYDKNEILDTHHGFFLINVSRFNQCYDFEVITYEVKYDNQYSSWYSNYFSLSIDDFKEVTVFDYFKPESSDHVIEKVEVYYWVFKQKTPIVIGFKTRGNTWFKYYLYYFLIWKHSQVYYKLPPGYFKSDTLKAELIKESNRLNKKLKFRVGVGRNTNIEVLNDTKFSKTFKRVVFIPKTDKGGDFIMFSSTIFTLQSKSGPKNQIYGPYLSKFEKSFNNICVYYSNQNIALLLEFVVDCNRKYVVRKDKDGFLWNEEVFIVKDEKDLESKLNNLNHQIISSITVTYNLNNKVSYPYINVQIDKDSISEFYNKYLHEPIYMELINKTTKFFLNNNELLVENSKPYNKKVIDLAVFYLTLKDNNNQIDSNPFLIEFTEYESNLGTSFSGQKCYYSKKNDDDNHWSRLKLGFMDVITILRDLSTFIDGKDFSKERKKIYDKFFELKTKPIPQDFSQGKVVKTVPVLQTESFLAKPKSPPEKHLHSSVSFKPQSNHSESTDAPSNSSDDQEEDEDEKEIEEEFSQNQTRQEQTKSVDHPYENQRPDIRHSSNTSQEYGRDSVLSPTHSPTLTSAQSEFSFGGSQEIDRHDESKGQQMGTYGRDETRSGQGTLNSKVDAETSRRYEPGSPEAGVTGRSQKGEEVGNRGGGGSSSEQESSERAGGKGAKRKQPSGSSPAVASIGAHETQTQPQLHSGDASSEEAGSSSSSIADGLKKAAGVGVAAIGVGATGGVVATHYPYAVVPIIQALF